MLQILFIFIVPTLLVFFNIIPVEHRHLALFISVLLTIYIILSERWTLKDLGVRIDNIKNIFIPYIVLTITAIIFIFVLAEILGNHTKEVSGDNHFIYGFIILSFKQELLFRGFLIPKLKKLFSGVFVVILVNALLFGFIHIIFPNTLLIFLLSFFLGLGFACVYYFWPNLIMATVSHSIINFLAVMHCFATITC